MRHVAPASGRLTVESDLIRYVVWRLSDYGGTGTVTRVVKIVYLVDLIYSREQRRHALAFSWRYYHYGPYATEVQEALDGLSGRRLVRTWRPDQTAGAPKVYRPSGGRPDELPPTRLVGLADELCSSWGETHLNRLLDYVYFETPPMRSAVRGQALDLLADLEERWPPFYKPLDAPEVSSRLQEGLVHWRQAHDRHLPRATLVPSPDYDEAYGQLMHQSGDRIENAPTISGRLGAADDFDPSDGW